MSSVASHPDRSFPRLHPRPARGWLNDPNGIHFADGRWHVFFQHNPASARHEDIAWGHVSSADLLRWEDHGVALQPQPGAADSFGCWTGVGLVDDGVATLLYSGVRALDGRSSVMLARAEGDGWAQSPHVAVGMPDDDAMLHVRDPFVFTLGGRRWGIQGAGTKAGAPLILLYDATDLRSWEYQGILLDGADPVAAGLPPSTVWECPQLVRVGDDWVLIASLWLNGVTTDVVYLVGSLEADDATGCRDSSPALRASSTTARASTRRRPSRRAAARTRSGSCSGAGRANSRPTACGRARRPTPTPSAGPGR